jgi:hypothetical protein
LGIKYYGRYVDDFVLIHHDREYLKSLIPSISTYLKEECHLLLHPSKIYLQHYSKGVLFLGTMIKPYRNYLRKRTFGYFYQKMQTLNKTLREAGDNEILFQEVLASFPQVINSYL